MKRLLTAAGIFLFINCVSGFNLSDHPVTIAEQQAMLREADDFIDALPDGFQDRLGDAIDHAMGGMSSDLQKFRISRVSPITPSAHIEAREISEEGINMRLYIPKERKDSTPILVFFHGGGWTLGGFNSSTAFCDSLAASGNIMVLTVDYSLAPEKPFPNGLKDCIRAVEYASTALCNRANSGLSICGDGAGANLALATAIYFQKNPVAKVDINSLLLFYPIIDLAPEKSGSWKRFARGYGLNRRLMEKSIEAYLIGSDSIARHTERFEEFYANPSIAPDSILKALPPTLIINAERDILLDQGTTFASHLSSLGVKTNHLILPGAVHLFVSEKGQPTAFRKSMEIATAFLNEE